MQAEIFVVEDDIDIRQTLADALEMEGYGVVVAVDGRDAIERLEAASSMPSLILLDLMMPRMNGLEFCAAMRNVARLAEIPVVLVSADTRLKEKAAAVGAAGILTKPVSLDALYATVARVLAASA